jgi:predicted tellurium resistance membrane protein TerC
MEGGGGDPTKVAKVTTLSSAIGQIIILDLVFSIDSIITAVGMVEELWVMYAAVVVSVGAMLVASEPISRFVNNHPAFKMLALSFLLLIGVSLIAEGLSFHIPKGYIYFSMAFALLVDIFQMKMNKPESDRVQDKELDLPDTEGKIKNEVRVD